MNGTHKTPPMPQTAWRAVNQAIEANVDPIGMATPLLHAQLAWLSHPQELAEVLGEFSCDLMALQWHSWQRALGLPSEDPIKPHRDDTRFSDPQWQDTASWDIAKQCYLLFTHQMQDMLYATPGLSGKERRRAAFWWRKWLNAMAPTNFLWTNPVALRKAVESNGETPPPFDVLYWNMDTTRMPAAMHQWYLREFYLNNKLIKKDMLTIAGEKIDLERIVQPVYAVSAEDDHVAPWRATFRINNVVYGPKRYVLSSSGHILGIVNPLVSPPRREFSVAAAERHDTPDSWRERAEQRAGSWWEDWMEWLKPQSGKLLKAGPVATKGYPALADAPGVYVMEP